MATTLPIVGEAIVTDEKTTTRYWYDWFLRLDAIARRAAIAAPTYGATVAIDASTGDQIITATNGVAFTIAAPTKAAAGTVMTVTIRNASGGALGAITWNAVFKMPAFVAPANGNSRSVTFHYDGSNWIQRYQSAADVPN